MEDARQRIEQLSGEVERLRRKLRELEMVKSELNDAKHALRESEVRFRATVASPDHAIIVISPCYEVTYWNQGAVNTFGYPEEEVLGQPITTVIPDLDEATFQRRTEHVCTGPEEKCRGANLEMKGLNKNGEVFPLEMFLSGWTARGETFHTVLARDISYRKTALRKLEVKTAEARQRSEDLESLVQTVAHDLKSPVVAIGGLARRLMKRTELLPSNPERDQILRQIKAGAESMERFLRDLLDGLSMTHTRQEWVSVSLDTAVHEVVGRHEHDLLEKGITVELEIEDSVPEVAGDRHRIIQILDNLLINAIVHMGKKTNPKVRIQCRSRKGFVVTSVTDNGIGIPKQYQDKIFERFFQSPDASDTRGQTGTGLGLFIAKRIVQSHNGRIWVESEEGQGATFSFSLPNFLTQDRADYQI